jgi:hypothetical protein
MREEITLAFLETPPTPEASAVMLEQQRLVS